MNVKSLNPNIQDIERIASCKEEWDTKQIPTQSTKLHIKLHEHVLKFNNFMFSITWKHYHK